VGFTGSKTTFQNVLVFRRVIPGQKADGHASGRLILQEQVPATPRLGPAETPVPGKAPAVGPVKPGLAAE
jgi:hypothetical protein